MKARSELLAMGRAACGHCRMCARREDGKKLWLRNNLSTIPSQFVDTFAVLFLMCSLGQIEWALFTSLLLNGFVFKVLVALVDTPLVYAGSWLIRRPFGLALGEEIEL